MVRFIHMADVHLGRLHTGGLSGERIARRRSEALQTFLQVLTAAEVQAVPLVLIAGDLFDNRFVDHTTVVEVIARMQAMSQTTFCICAGNHDYAAAHSPYRTFTWPENVRLFLSDWEQASLDHLGVTVHGRGFTAPECTEAYLRDYRVPAEENRLHVVLLHADYPTATSRYLPVARADLQNCGADYIALGHIHNPQTVVAGGRVLAAYSGALEPLDYGETGEHGYYLGELVKGGAKLQFVPAAVRHYHQIYVSIDGAESMDTIVQAVDEALTAVPHADMVRVILQGHVSTRFTLDTTRLAAVCERYFACELVSELIYDADLEQLAEGYTVRAEFIRRMRQQMEAGDAETARIARQALLMGLDALAGKEVKAR